MQPNVVKLTLYRAQAGFDIAQAAASGLRGKRHREKLVDAGETPRSMVAEMTFDEQPKLVFGKEVHELGEDRPPLTHAEASWIEWLQHAEKAESN